MSIGKESAYWIDGRSVRVPLVEAIDCEWQVLLAAVLPMNLTEWPSTALNRHRLHDRPKCSGRCRAATSRNVTFSSLKQSIKYSGLG